MANGRNFKWGTLLQDKIWTKVKLVESECLSYESFMLDDFKVQIGDYVLIRSGSTCDIVKGYVARVKALYDTGALNDSSHRAMVQWFCRGKDINKKLLKSAKKYPKPPEPFQEVFTDKRNACIDDIDAETIFLRCQVSKVTTNLSNLPNITESELPNFILRWKYFGQTLEPVLPCHPSGLENDSLNKNHLDERVSYDSDDVSTKRKHYTKSEMTIFKVKSPDKYYHTPTTNSKLKMKLIRMSSQQPKKTKPEIENCLEYVEKISAKKSPNGNKEVKKKLHLDEKESHSLRSFSGRKIKINKRYMNESSSEEEPGEIVKDVCVTRVNQKLVPRDCIVSLVRSPVHLSSPKLREDFKTPVKSTGCTAPNSVNSTETPGRGRRAGIARSTRRIVFSSDDELSCSPVKRSKETPVMHTRSGRKIKIRLWDDGIKSEDSPKIKTRAVLTSDDNFTESEDSDFEKPRYCKSNRRRNVKPRTPQSKKKINQGVLLSISKRANAVVVPETEAEQARLQLHVSSIPEALPCREKEFAEIYTFVKGKISTGTGGCMYLSGVPGTGKTATVTGVIRHLQKAFENEKLPHFKFISINGMKMTEPRQAFVQIYKGISGQKATAAHAIEILSKYFEKNGKTNDREMVVLLVDELDLLCNRKQDVFYNLFNWPNKPKSHLVVIAIANTMDLPERVMKHRIVSRVGMTRITFQPYTFSQLQEIISARLSGNEIFDCDSVQFIARKVAAVSGDARRALDICRRAAELIGTLPGSPSKRRGCVGMTEANKAIQEMFSSPKIEAIRHASLQERTFLKAVVCEFQRTGLEESTFSKIYRHHLVLCRIEGIYVPNTCEVLSICARLDSCRLLILENTEMDILQKVKLNLSTDDVTFALKATSN